LKLPRNIFGLFQQDCTTRFSDHDPCKNIVSNDLTDDVPPTLSLNIYFPYPNESSFLLGEWYWSGGGRKSQSSFQHLIKIVGHPNFQPEDVASSNFWLIDAHLTGGYWLNSEEDWEDEPCDGDWVKTPIKIKVPFQKRMLHPGQKVFDAGILHHRKLVSVLREKITWPSIHPHLHFKPYEYFW
jgi:hypothetical protein